MNRESDGPLTPAELEMLNWNTPILKPNGKLEPLDVEYEYMLAVMARARHESGRSITNLDDLARIARKHGQLVEDSHLPEKPWRTPNAPGLSTFVVGRSPQHSKSPSSG